jgi:hypothetical protein
MTTLKTVPLSCVRVIILLLDIPLYGLVAVVMFGSLERFRRAIKLTYIFKYRGGPEASDWPTESARYILFVIICLLATAAEFDLVDFTRSRFQLHSVSSTAQVEQFAREAPRNE